jgi:multiple sugar transport system permease protein
VKLDRQWKIDIRAYLFLFPALSLIIVFKLVPLFVVMGESLYKVSYLRGTKIFVGIGNYIDLFTDRSFWYSVWVTTKFNILINPIQVVVALVMALLINNENYRGRMVYRFMFFIPLGVSLAVTTTYFGIIFSPGNGLLNYILNAFGLPIQPFLNSETQAFWIIILIASWKGCSYWMIFILVGLKNISKEIYEACQVDGVGSINTFIYITLPLLKKTLLFVFVADTAANFMLFIPMYMLTRGGPNNSTRVLMYEAYQKVMLQGNTGHGMAVNAVLMFILVMVIAMQFNFSREKEK